MDLDILLRGVVESVGGAASSTGCRQRGLGSVCRDSPRAIVAMAPGKLDLRIHVRQLVLDGLKRADLSAEGGSIEGVGASHLQRRLRGAHLFACKEDGCSL